MKTLHLIIIFLSCSILQLQAQTRLNVEGDANILGRISTKVADRSVIIGEDAGLNLNNNANSNVFIGVQAGRDSEDVENSIFIGRGTGLNHQGEDNIFIGRSAGSLSNNGGGNKNIFLGTNAGNNATGRENIFIGDGAGSGLFNTGNFNIFIGLESGSSSTTGGDNVFLGNFSGENNTTGTNNVFIGGKSGENNTTADDLTFVGNFAGNNNTTGTSNNFIGSNAGLSNTTGNSNTFVGRTAGRENTTGSRNTFLGNRAGDDNISGSDLVAIGFNASPSNNNLQNSIAIGSHTIPNQSNQVVLGNTATEELRAYNNWSTLSDKRFKSNIKNNVKGLDFILQLRPVTYRVNAKKLDQFLRSPLGKINAVDTIETYQAALKAKSNITYTGFIAQEVEKAASKSSFHFSGIVAPEDENDHYTLRYAEFVVPLVKAIQEQQEIIEEKEQKIEDLEARLERLEALMSTNLKQIESRTAIIDPHLTKLSQNIPNPANGVTVIEYVIPADAKEAKLLISNVEGKIVMHQDLPSKGLGHLELQSSDFRGGQYFYSLIIDGNVFDTKQMLLGNL